MANNSGKASPKEKEMFEAGWVWRKNYPIKEAIERLRFYQATLGKSNVQLVNEAYEDGILIHSKAAIYVKEKELRSIGRKIDITRYS